MRYLYGDLSEARCQEDVLTLLQRVVDMSVEVLKLHEQMDDALLNMQEERNRLTQAVDDIDTFHQGLRKSIDRRIAERPQGDVLSSVAQAVIATLDQHATDGKTRMSAEVERNIQEMQSRIDGLGRVSLETMKKFFMTSGLPMSESSMSCALEGLAYRADCVVVDTTGIRCTFILNTATSQFFSGPKRFGDLVPGRLEIPLGTKKGWLKKDPVPELIRVDDAMVSSVSDSPEFGEYKLDLRAGSEVQGVLVRIKKDPHPAVRVFKEEGRGQQPVSSDLFSHSHIEALTRFWKQLLPHIQALYRAREQLSSVVVDEQDVLEGRLFSEVVHRLVEFLAPIVREIDSHSQAPGELSLKIEHTAEGKREEYFLAKSILTERINELREPHRHLFAGLGLEDRKSPIREVQKDETVEIPDMTQKLRDMLSSPSTESTGPAGPKQS